MDENSPGILLYRAVVSGDIQLAKALLRSGANVNTRPDVEGSWKSDTSLHQAVKKGDAAMVKLLLEAPDLDIMARDELSYTAFTRAAQKGNNTIVELLLGRVLEPSASTKSVYIYGGTRKPAILHQYAYRDEIVKAIVGTINHHQDSTLDLLLETDIKNKLDGHGGEEIMYVAVMNRRASVMERLLRLTNIPINGIISKATHTEDPQDLEKFPLFGASRGSTAIELAAEYDIPEVVRLLFERDDIKLSPELKELKRECKNHDLDIHIALPFIVDALKRNGPWIVSQSNAIPASDKENYLNFLLTMSQDRGVRDDLAHDVGTRAEVQRRVSIYCGLGGVAPPVERHSSITNHIYITGTEAQIRYRPFATDDHELFRIIAKVVGNLEDAIKMLQAAKECTTEVTILTSCPGRWGPKEAQTIQMVSVQVKQIDSFYVSLLRSLFKMVQESANRTYQGEVDCIVK